MDGPVRSTFLNPKSRVDPNEVTPPTKEDWVGTAEHTTDKRKYTDGYRCMDLRFQRIDTRNRRRMFRPTAEIARGESRYQVSNQYTFATLPAARRDPCRWSVGCVKK